jgi:excisionase family DNA binding protein
MLRIRTINEAYNEIKASDAGTALSPYAIRRMIIEGKIPYIKAGNKYLLDLDVLEAFLRNPAPAASSQPKGIRPVRC